MANMGYCRFENTAADLRDCLEHIDDDLSLKEAEARVKLVKTCQKILDSVDVECLTEDLEEREQI